MEKKSKMPMIYGYLVLLVSVITFIICVASLINAVIDIGDPLHATTSYTKQPSLASYENYKMDILSSTADKEGAYVPDEQTIKGMYDAAVEDKTRSVLHSSYRTIFVSGILIVICIVLFLTHWFWMRKLGKEKAQ